MGTSKLQADCGLTTILVWKLAKPHRRKIVALEHRRKTYKTVAWYNVQPSAAPSKLLWNPSLQAPAIIGGLIIGGLTILLHMPLPTHGTPQASLFASSENAISTPILFNKLYVYSMYGACVY